jgi:pyrimidine-nucleoside phosphorylase
MNFLTHIETKREGGALPSGLIQSLVREFTLGRIPDYQMAAFLMAVYFRGLTCEETRAFTLAMRDSGDVLEFPEDSRPVVDKHSTGGVGDKVSLALAPLLACLGFRVPMVSGRGLGITGGTLDKLESIPGLTTGLSPARILEQVQTIGVAMAGQTETMVPADKALYALRDATATVPSIPLITASILSKKLAEGLEALLLDVKFGSGAFMPDLERARELARVMTQLGQDCGLRTRALLTDMNTPLGRAAGNWLEVKESHECLEGRGPEDLRELVTACAAQLLVLSGRAKDFQAARVQVEACLASGAPRNKWMEMLRAQGMDQTAYENRLAQDSLAPIVRALPAAREGFVVRCDAGVIGEVVRDLGGGRQTKDAAIHPEVGLDWMVKPGQRVARGDDLCRIHALDAAAAERAGKRLECAFDLGEEPPEASALVAEVISWEENPAPGNAASGFRTVP